MADSAFLSLLSLSNPLHPGGASDVGRDYSTWKELLRLADINRTYLLVYRHLLDQAEFLPPGIWSELERESHLRLSVWSTILQEVARIEACLKGTSIKWMLIKTIRDFPREIRDLDLLVFDDKLGPVREALAPLGYAQSGKLSGFKMELKTYKTIEKERRVAVAIDVHSRVSYEGITFIDQKELWKGRRTTLVDGTTVYVPSYEHEVMTTILNSFFGDGGLRLTDVLEYGHLQSTGAKLSEVREVAQAQGWGLAFREFVSKVKPYLDFLASTGHGKGIIRSPATLPVLPASFAKSILLEALLEKAVHDLGHGAGFLVPSWARIGMKFASRMGRDHLRRDSWNQIFNR